jgi:hypothetical protein
VPQAPGSPVGAGDGSGSDGDLRNAILAANFNGGTNTITFSCSGTITLGGPLPPIASSTTIDGGTFGNIVLDGGNAFRVFFVDVGTVTLKNLKIQNAMAQGGNGVDGGGGGAGLGAGLFINQATANVTLQTVQFVNCQAVGGSGASFAGSGSGGGGGMVFSGAVGVVFTNGGGGGGMQGPGSGATGGIGGGGGGGARNGSGTPGNGGRAYDAANGTGNAAGAGGSSTIFGGQGGNGGFGGGGAGGGGGLSPGHGSCGGTGGFGGGGGACDSSQFAGGPGGPGGGGGGDFVGGGNAPGGALSALVSGGNGDGNGDGGGGAAAGPAIFIVAGSLTAGASCGAQGSATGGAPGNNSFGASSGGADATPVFNFAGNVNGSTFPGPLSSVCTAVPNTVTQLVVTAPASVAAGVAGSFTVTAVDAFGTVSPYAGTVHFSSTDPSAVLPANYTFKGPDAGTHTFSFTLNQSGTRTITATDAGTSSITGTSGNILVVGAATHFTVTAPATATPGTAFSVTVTALDSLNNVATGYTGTVHFTGTDVQAVLPADSTLTNGTGTFSTTLKTAGSQTISATDITTPALTGTSGTIVVSALPATHLSVSAPATATAGTSFSFTVTALDMFNNTASTYGGMVHFVSTDLTATLPANYQFVAGDQGTHTFSATLKTAGNQTINATDTITAGITGTSGTIVVSGGAATHLSVSAPATAVAGFPLNFTVTALDQFNNTATTYSATVTFTSTDAAATLPANYPFVASDHGTHTFTAFMGTAGNQTITATDNAVPPATGTSNTIVVSAGAATHLLISAPATATAGTAFNFTVTAQDQFNNTATGFSGTIQFTSTDFRAVLPAASTLTAGTGTFSATLKTTGNQTISGNTGAGLPPPGNVLSAQVKQLGAHAPLQLLVFGTSNNILVSAAPATQFLISAPATATAGSAFTFTVTALDQFNNTATGYTGKVHFTSTDGQAVLPANSTLTNGTGSFSATLKTTGNQTIVGTDTVTSSITGSSNTITVGVATGVHFSVSAPAAATAGTAFNFTVTALDPFNNTVTTYGGTVHFTGSDGQAVLPANSTLTSGVGTFSATLKTAGTQTLTATDTATSTITGTSNTIAVAAAAATHFTVSAPATALSGTAFNFTVTALDPFTNTATGYSGTAHFTSTDPAAVLPANSTLTSGVGTFSATLNTAGNQTITATDSTTASITGTSGNISVTAVTPTHFSVAAPSTATAGTPFNFMVTALTASNTTATGYTGTVHFSGSDAQGVLPANATLTNGIGTFSATLKTAGSQSLTATDTANASIAGTSNAIVVSAAGVLHFNVSAPASATAGAAFNFTVQAADVYNNIATGYSGTAAFSSNDAKAALPANATLTNGVGTFSATLKTAGLRTITATDTANGAIKGTSANITVNPGPPAAITLGGNNQTANINSPFAGPLTVTVVDAYGNPIPGLTVTFTAPLTGASAIFFGGSTGSSLLSASMAAHPERPETPALRPRLSANTGTAVTNPQGTASIDATANGTGGTFAVTAAAGTLTGTFSLTNIVPVPPMLNPQVDPKYLTLRYTQAIPNGPAVQPASAPVAITTDLPSTFTATVYVPWISVSPASGNTNRTVTISGNGANLAQGIYSTSIVFTFGDNSTIVYPVQLYVFGPPQFKPDATGLSFTAQVGSTTMQSQSFIMRSAGGDFPATVSMADVTGGGGGSWLAVTPASISTPASIQAQVNPTGLAVGVYQKNIVFTGAATNTPFNVPVTLTITAGLPSMAIASVVNAASFATGPVAPNTMVTVYGTYPGCVSNAQATVDGAATTVFYSSSTQVSLLIPAAVQGESAAQLQISCAGLTAPPLSVAIAAVSPGLFTVSQDGRGQAGVVNPDGSIDIASAAGSVIQLYGTGFGAYAAPGSDGLTWLAQTVTASVGGTPARVLYAGQAPGNTKGLQQIDILVPAGAASGAMLPLQLTIGGASTQSGVMLGIQ